MTNPVASQQPAPIQRYGQKRDFEDYPVGQVRRMDDGDLVLYEDHLAAVREAEHKVLEKAASAICPLCAGENKYTGAIPRQDGEDFYHRWSDTHQIAARCKSSAIYRLALATPLGAARQIGK
jgi:hypothetical protein